MTDEFIKIPIDRKTTLYITDKMAKSIVAQNRYFFFIYNLHVLQYRNLHNATDKTL